MGTPLWHRALLWAWVVAADVVLCAGTVERWLRGR